MSSTISATKSQHIHPSTRKPSHALVSLRILPATKDKLRITLDDLNKKEFGRKLRMDDLLECLLQHKSFDAMNALTLSTMSNSDRLEMRYREYIQANGHVSKDEFLGILLNAENAQSAGIAR